MEIITQTIGILGMTMNVLSFQQKKQRNVILMQLCGAALFTVHYLLLGLAQDCILIGSFLNAIGIVRAYVFSHKDKFHTEKRGWIYLFSLLFVASYILTFTVLGMEKTAANLVIEFVPVAAMIIATVGFSMKTAKNIRTLALIYSPMWLVYNIIRMSIGGSLCEIFTIVSVGIGMLRHDIKKKEDVCA